MRIRDNSLLPEEAYDEHSDLISFFKNKTLSELEFKHLFIFPKAVSDSEDLDSSQFVLKSSSHGIRTTNLMGIIGHKDKQFFIGSRFDYKNDYFFFYMLKKVININLLSTNVGSERKVGFLDLLVILFPKYLNSALKKGLYKEYKVRYHNNQNIKGAIDFKRHIKLNTPFRGNIAYNTREFSYENHVIHLIRYTIEFIKRRNLLRSIIYSDEETRQNVQLIESSSFEYTKQEISKVIHANIIKPVRHGYYTEYQELQKLCVAILRNDSLKYSNQSDNEVYGILFDGAWLFEEYVNTIIGDSFIHTMNKAKMGRQYLFNNGIGPIYPDFIGKDGSIADAKYKPIGNISGSDYLQILAYMLRFETNRGYFIFPHQENLSNVSKKSLSLLKGLSGNTVKRDDVKVSKVGIVIPSLSNTYERFEEEMRIQENRLKKKLNYGVKLFR